MKHMGSKEKFDMGLLMCVELCFFPSPLYSFWELSSSFFSFLIYNEHQKIWKWRWKKSQKCVNKYRSWEDVQLNSLILMENNLIALHLCKSISYICKKKLIACISHFRNTSSLTMFNLFFSLGRKVPTHSHRHPSPSPLALQPEIDFWFFYERDTSPSFHPPYIKRSNSP